MSLSLLDADGKLIGTIVTSSSSQNPSPVVPLAPSLSAIAPLTQPNKHPLDDIQIVSAKRQYHASCTSDWCISRIRELESRVQSQRTIIDEYKYIVDCHRTLLQQMRSSSALLVPDEATARHVKTLQHSHPSTDEFKTTWGVIVSAIARFRDIITLLKADHQLQTDHDLSFAPPITPTAPFNLVKRQLANDLETLAKYETDRPNFSHLALMFGSANKITECLTAILNTVADPKTIILPLLSRIMFSNDRVSLHPEIVLELPYHPDSNEYNHNGDYLASICEVVTAGLMAKESLVGFIIKVAAVFIPIWVDCRRKSVLLFGGEVWSDAKLKLVFSEALDGELGQGEGMWTCRQALFNTLQHNAVDSIYLAIYTLHSFAADPNLASSPTIQDDISQRLGGPTQMISLAYGRSLIQDWNLLQGVYDVLNIAVR